MMKEVVAWRVAERIVLLPLLIACCTACGYRENEFHSFTQCIRPIQASTALTQGLYRDTEHNCYGQRWRFPTPIHTSMHVAYKPVSQALSVEVEDSAATWMQQHRQAQLIPPVDYRRFRIRPAFEPPHDRQIRSRGNAAVGMSDAPPRFGLNMKHHIDPDGSEDALFYPPAGKEYFVLCRPAKRVNGRRAIEHSNCEVRVAFHDHLDLDYLVHYDDLQRLDAINDRLVEWVESFLTVEFGCYMPSCPSAAGCA